MSHLDREPTYQKRIVIPAADTYTFKVPRGATGIIQCVSTSSLTYILKVSLSPTPAAQDWSGCRIQKFEGTLTAAGSAVTPSAADLHYFSAIGVEWVQLICTGTGELYLKISDAQVSAPLAAGGATTATVSGTVTVDSELPAAAALADAASAAPTTPTVGSVPLVMNATTVDRQRAVVAALDSAGTGIAAAGMVGQLDDVSTATVTENQFAPVRISTRRAMLVEGVASGTAVPISGTVTANAGTGTLAVDSELPAAAALADAASNPTTPTVGAAALVWNGTTWDRMPGSTVGTKIHGDTASAATDANNPVKIGSKAASAQLTAVTAGQRVDAQADLHGNIRTRVGHQGPAASIWAIHHLPAANTVATISKAAGTGTQRHVCTALTVKLAAGATAPTAVNTSVSLIDGATGGTTYLWRATISLPATAGADTGVALSGLWLPGSQATAMTLEFAAAGGANTIESVSFSGITINE